MQSTNSEAQATQTGQAIIINNITCKQLYDLFSPMFGPDGMFKVLVEGGQQLTITKDGLPLCTNLQFNHPTAALISKSAKALFNSTGDGIKTFVMMCTDIFNQAYNFYNDGTPVAHIINSLHLVSNDIMIFLQKNSMQLTDANLDKLIYSSLLTKIKKPEFLVDILKKAIINLSMGKIMDTDMIEIMNMERGDIRNSLFIEGLVLDHSGRHHAMPKQLTEVCVIVSNMSLEYEKPEINAEFCYSDVYKREELATTENKFIVDKAMAVAKFAKQIKAESGKDVLFITEKGIDLDSLDVLAAEGVLGLRRAKRRNLERIVRMCGGTIVSEISQLRRENMGYCQRVRVEDFGDNKYTIMDGMPQKGACTILLRGEFDYAHYCKSIKGTLNSIITAIKAKCCIEGGLTLYRKLSEFLDDKTKEVHPTDIVGYKIMSLVYRNFIKVLFKNKGVEIGESTENLFRGQLETGKIIENLAVVAGVTNSAIITAINLLMCDEIIKAGRPIKSQENQ